MSQIVVDTDVASYPWHSLAEEYVRDLGGSQPILSFMPIAELRMGAMSANWGGHRRLLLDRFEEVCPGSITKSKRGQQNGRGGRGGRGGE